MTRYYPDIIINRVYWYITHWIDRRENIYGPNFILGQIHSWAINFRGGLLAWFNLIRSNVEVSWTLDRSLGRYADLYNAVGFVKSY